MGGDRQGQSRNLPTPTGPWLCPLLRPFPFKVLGRNSPAPPGEKGGLEGWDWSGLLGEET